MKASRFVRDWLSKSDAMRGYTVISGVHHENLRCTPQVPRPRAAMGCSEEQEGRKWPSI